MHVDALVRDKRIVICAGSGGVGKTTTAAALAMGLAERGAKVAVVTIDPAKRLADSLGLEELGNEPRLVDPERFAGHGVEMRGELWALMLDAKRTFDELIDHLAPDDEHARRGVRQPDLPAALGRGRRLAGVHRHREALRARPGRRLRRARPRHAALAQRARLPRRAAADRDFFQGRAIRLFLRPAGLGGKLIGRGTGVVFGLMQRVTGVDLLRDLSVFFRTLGGMIDGFTERARRVGALLEDPATTFLLVTSPRHDPVEEAIYFHSKLREASMPFGGLVVNRVHAAPDLDGALPGRWRARSTTRWRGGSSLGARAGGARRARRGERRAPARRLGDPPAIIVPELDDDVHDVDGLALVRAYLFDEASRG